MKINLNKLTVVGALVIFALLPLLARADTAVPAWVQCYNGPGDSCDEACAMAVDGSNNVVVTGSLSNGTNDDIFTIKYLCALSPLMTGLQSANGALQLRVDDVLQSGTLGD